MTEVGHRKKRHSDECCKPNLRWTAAHTNSLVRHFEPDRLAKSLCRCSAVLVRQRSHCVLIDGFCSATTPLARTVGTTSRISFRPNYSHAPPMSHRVCTTNIHEDSCRLPQFEVVLSRVGPERILSALYFQAVVSNAWQFTHKSHNVGTHLFGRSVFASRISRGGASP